MVDFSNTKILSYYDGRHCVLQIQWTPLVCTLRLGQNNDPDIVVDVESLGYLKKYLPNISFKSDRKSKVVDILSSYVRCQQGRIVRTLLLIQEQETKD